MKSTKSIKSRRDFLKGAATTAAGVGIVATVATKTASASGLEKHSSSDYRETKHIKTYYELAKF